MYIISRQYKYKLFKQKISFSFNKKKLSIIICIVYERGVRGVRIIHGWRTIELVAVASSDLNKVDFNFTSLIRIIKKKFHIYLSKIKSLLVFTSRINLTKHFITIPNSIYNFRSINILFV